MKKKISFFIILAVLCTALVMMFGCGETPAPTPDNGGNTDGGNTDSGNTDGNTPAAWNSDATHHWHDDSDKAEHTFGEWVTKEEPKDCVVPGVKEHVCTVCEYRAVEPIPAPGHTYASAWKYDADNHWNLGNCGHNSEKGNIAPHNFENGACTVCKMAQPGTKGLVYENKGLSATLIGLEEGTVIKGSVIIDQKNGANKVTMIGSRVFENCTGMTSVSIPDTVTEIGAGAFANCTGLKSVVLPANLTTIAKDAFLNCTALETVTFGTKVRTIADHAFDGCVKLSAVVLPNTLTSIGAYAFNACEKLATVTFGTGLKTLGIRAFSDCTALEEITLPTGMTRIGKSAFEGTAYIANAAYYEDNVLYNGTYILRADPAISGAYTVKTGTALIADGAFANCSGLTLVSGLTSSVKIGTDAFLGCNKKINLGTIVTEGDFEFLSDTNGYHLIGYIGTSTEVSLPLSVGGNTYDIYKYAFAGRTDITSVTISGGVTAIGENAFDTCLSLETIAIGSAAAPTIGKEAFIACESLKNVTLGSITTIGDRAFAGCTSMTELTIPATVTAIGDRAFLACEKLAKVYWNATVVTVGEDAFDKCISVAELYITDLTAWMTTVEFANTGAHPFTYYFEGESNKIFLNNTELTEVVIPETVTRVSSYVFFNCDRITTLTVHTGVTCIGKGAFRTYANGGLTTVNCTTGGWMQYERENGTVAGIPLNPGAENENELTAELVKSSLIYFFIIK